MPAPLDDADTAALLEQFHAVQLHIGSEQARVSPAGVAISAGDRARELDVKVAPTIILFSA